MGMTVVEVFRYLHLPVFPVLNMSLDHMLVITGCVMERGGCGRGAMRCFPSSLTLVPLRNQTATCLKDCVYVCMDSVETVTTQTANCCYNT
jgi:hypothetical protein